jgi:hypothetical protein
MPSGQIALAPDRADRKRVVAALLATCCFPETRTQLCPVRLAKGSARVAFLLRSEFLFAKPDGEIVDAREEAVERIVRALNLAFF